MARHEASQEHVGILKATNAFRSLGNFIHPALPVSSGRDSKSCWRWSVLSGVYARGSKRTQGNGKNLLWTHRAGDLIL